MKTAIVLSDVHINALEGLPEAYKTVKRYAKDKTWDYCIILGDFLDCACVSPHNKEITSDLENRRLIDDYNMAKKEFDWWLQRVDHIYYTVGNHEYWIEKYLNKFPNAGVGFIELENGLFNGYEGSVTMVPFNQHLKIGDQSFTHGEYCNVYDAKKNCLESGCNLLYGHTHRRQMAEHVFKGGRTIRCQSLGCLCNKNPGYVKGFHRHWRNAFAEVTWYKKGRSSVRTHDFDNDGFFDGTKFWKMKGDKR